MAVPLRQIVAACAVLTSLGLQSVAARSMAPRVVFAPVLIYHHVKWLKPQDNAIERGLTVLPSEFQAQLRYLAGAHYHPITAAQLVTYLHAGGTLPSKPVVLTFDDGYADMYATAYPMLRQYHMRATFFVVPGFLGTARYLSWNQVKEMAAHGMDIEAHTMTHPDLTLVPAAQARGEIVESRNRLQAALHRSVRVFAYPYGDYNFSILADVAHAGYWGAFTTHQGWWQSSGAPLTLPRVYVDMDDTVRTFAGRLRADATILAEDPT